MTKGRRSWVKRCDTRLTPRPYMAFTRWTTRADAVFNDRKERLERQKKVRARVEAVSVDKEVD